MENSMDWNYVFWNNRDRHSFFSFGAAINHMGQLFALHFIGICTIDISPGRQFQLVYAEDTEFTANIHTAFQCRASRRRRSSRFIQSDQCSCISTTTTGKSLSRFIFHEIYLNDWPNNAWSHTSRSMLFKLNATLAQIIQKVYQKWIECDNVMALSIKFYTNF